MKMRVTMMMLMVMLLKMILNSGQGRKDGNDGDDKQ